MALTKQITTIEKDDVLAGHIIQFMYKNKSNLALVIDPKTTVVTDAFQGRLGKLHAIKLKELDDRLLLELTKGIYKPGTGRDKGVSSVELVKRFKHSTFAIDGRSAYRTYDRDQLGTIELIALGNSNTTKTEKHTVGMSAVYGVTHSEKEGFVHLLPKDYPTFAQELASVGYRTFFEGPSGHERSTLELFDLLEIKNIITARSWEPSNEEFVSIRNELGYDEAFTALGAKVAGWFNQTIDDGQGLPNMMSEWRKTGEPLTEKIGNVFRKSVGEVTYNLFLEHFTEYSGRFSRRELTRYLDQPGFDANGNYTEALKEFNEAGHDQVFPEDEGLPFGKLKESEQNFNRIRRVHLKRMMQKNPGVYFIGIGHIDELRNGK